MTFFSQTFFFFLTQDAGTYLTFDKARNFKWTQVQED